MFSEFLCANKFVCGLYTKSLFGRYKVLGSHFLSWTILNVIFHLLLAVGFAVKNTADNLIFKIVLVIFCLYWNFVGIQPFS